MIGILLLWIALIPVIPAYGKQATVSNEYIQRQTKNPVTQHKSILSNPLSESIRRYFTHSLQQKNVSGATRSFLVKNRLARFYAARAYQPAWLKRSMITELISAIESAAEDGLDPSDYHITEIKALYSHSPATPEQAAKSDILLSDALFTLAEHLRYGKVNPVSLDPHWNISDFKKRSSLDFMLQQAIANERIAVFLQELHPQHFVYDALKKELVRYRTIAKAGNWPHLVDGAILKEGDMDARILQFRKRLSFSDDIMLSNADTSSVYSSEMVEAVKHFQKTNGIDADGVIGPATVKAMNIPVERRVDQLRINLERCRWLLNDLEQTCVLVNIAEFTLYYVEKGIYRWKTRVIVGQPFRETPVFKANMQYVIFNPSWVVPPTILTKDVLPAIRKNSSYLTKKKLNIFDRNGALVNPALVDWSKYTTENFPYRLQQTAGEHGALGRIKFMLPNKYTVYLHDTPAKELFAKNIRTFSSGCIRVDNPQELVRLVLHDSVKWSKERIIATINSEKTIAVYLPKRIPVFIVYLTAFAENDHIVFLDDVYNRDKALLEALDKPVLLVPQ